MDYQWYGFRVSQHNLCPLLRLPKMGWSKLWCLDTYHKGRMVGWFSCKWNDDQQSTIEKSVMPWLTTDSLTNELLSFKQDRSTYVYV